MAPLPVRKLAIFLAYATMVPIVGMAVVALATGATQELHEHFATPDVYAADLIAQAGPLRVLFAFDIAFSILYAVYFTVFATHIRGRGAPTLLLWVALGAMLATSVLDLVEDQHIIAMLDSAQHGVAPAAESIAWQVTESGTKFSVSFLALFAFGLALPRTGKLATVLTLFLTVGTLLNAIAAYAVPTTSPLGIEVGRWVGFAISFGLAIAWLGREPD